MREQRRVIADAPLYKQRCRYTGELHDVDLHGNHNLHVVCTSKGQDMDKMLSTLRRNLGGMPVKLVGIDVEYTHYVKPQRAAVLQLCVEKECLVFHISAAKHRPMDLDKFLMNAEYTFVGFAIEGDKSKLKLSGLEINFDNCIDIQVEWRDPYNKKEFDSLADVVGRMIDIHYHTLWGFFPLPDKLINYAAIDAFAIYESWRIIYDVIMGLDRAKREKEAKKKKKNKAVIQYSN
ncbi:3'-5' exonuclease-like [Aegilops tauschii subsp. strangulata]|uniref:3'-5' exonuclease-like n=1 Tax=Aegilops tauschii subsp. strangulata TaxID=200361 RepID=UPI00098A86D5|nr:Werner syndrome ATP-dependent helicase homolog [Aegilops tauschii subsp. strangulata]